MPERSGWRWLRRSTGEESEIWQEVPAQPRAENAAEKRRERETQRRGQEQRQQGGRRRDEEE